MRIYGAFLIHLILCEIEDLFLQITNFLWADAQRIRMNRSWSVQNQLQYFGHLPYWADLPYGTYLQLLSTDFSHILTHSSLSMQISKWGFSWWSWYSARHSMYAFKTTASNRAHSPPGIKSLSILPLAMLVANASFVFKDAGSIQKEEEVENIWHRMRRCAVCCYACGETGWEGGRGERSGFHTCDPM